MRCGPGILVACCALLAACGGTRERPGVTEPRAAAHDAAQICRVVAAGRHLPSEIRETSGLARSARDGARFWTLNDSGNTPELFAFDERGRIVQRVRVTGAVQRDWEDLESAPCDGATCLYIADIGDNFAVRDHITLYRVPEPAPGVRQSAPAVALHARYPGGPRDAEALFFGPGYVPFIVTKGRNESIELYRFPLPLQPGHAVMLERVRELLPKPADELDRVTAATATPDGRWVGVRTYRHLYLYRAEQLVGTGEALPIVVDLRPLRESQGEALVLADDGTVWLSSEAEDARLLPTWSRLSCALPSQPAPRIEQRPANSY